MNFKNAVIDDVCDFVGGSQPPKEDFISEYKEGYIRLIQTRDYKTDDFLTYIPIKKAKRFCSKEDIMIGRYGPPIFQICRGIEGSYNVALMKAVPKSSILNEYLYYLLKQEAIFNYVDRLSLRTSGQTGVDLYALGNYPVLLPDLPYQQLVVNVLKSLDNKIQLNNRINAELEAMAKTLYDYWFVQFDFPDADSKPYKTSGGKMVFNAKLKREIPDSWDVYKLEDILQCNYKSITKNNQYKFINYLDTSNLTENVVDQVQNINLEYEELPSRAQRVIEKDDILYSTVRPNQRHFGIIKEPLENLIASTGFAQLTSKIGSIKNELIYLYLISESTINRLQKIAVSSVSSYPSISPNDLLALNIALPKDEDILIKISSVLVPVFEKKAIYQKQNKQLAELRDWLLPMLMNGQVVVKDER